jgi:hypothetical protein
MASNMNNWFHFEQYQPLGIYILHFDLISSPLLCIGQQGIIDTLFFFFFFPKYLHTTSHLCSYLNFQVGLVVVALPLIPVNQRFCNSVVFHAVSGQPRPEQATEAPRQPLPYFSIVMALYKSLRMRGRLFEVTVLSSKGPFLRDSRFTKTIQAIELPSGKCGVQ